MVHPGGLPEGEACLSERIDHGGLELPAQVTADGKTPGDQVANTSRRAITKPCN